MGIPILRLLNPRTCEIQSDAYLKQIVKSIKISLNDNLDVREDVCSQPQIAQLIVIHFVKASAG